MTTPAPNDDLVRELRSAAEWHRIEHDGDLDGSTAPLRAAAALEAQAERISVLERALERIAEWEMPETGKKWSNGTPMSYGAAYGSNGERDVICEIARTTLTGARQWTD